MSYENAKILGRQVLHILNLELYIIVQKLRTLNLNLYVFVEINQLIRIIFIRMYIIDNILNCRS